MCTEWRSALVLCWLSAASIARADPGTLAGTSVTLASAHDSNGSASSRGASTAAAQGRLTVSRDQKYPLKMDLQFEVPVPLTDERNSAGTGLGISGYFGWDLGFLVPTANIGWSWAPLNVPAQLGENRLLNRFHYGLGLMAEFDNASIVVPVVGAMLDLNWWQAAGFNDVPCGGSYFWGCYKSDTYHYTTGFTFKAGIDIRFPRRDRYTLGAGLLPSVTLSGGPFRDAEWWLAPYSALTIRI